MRKPLTFYKIRGFYGGVKLTYTYTSIQLYRFPWPFNSVFKARLSAIGTEIIHNIRHAVQNSYNYK